MGSFSTRLLVPGPLKNYTEVKSEKLAVPTIIFFGQNHLTKNAM
jgi:hypothetical protein